MPVAHHPIRCAVGAFLVLLIVAGPAGWRMETGVVRGQAQVDAQHSANMAAGLKLFRDEVRSVLIERCLECHGGAETEGELDIRTRESLLKGGAEGKTIVPGKSRQSRLYKLITHQVAPEMPYEEQKLSDKQIAGIAKWIDLGAPYDKPLGGVRVETHWTQRRIAPRTRNFWAFRPLSDPTPPRVTNEAWCRTPADRFVLAAQEKRGLTPSVPADRRVLIRRAYFDLIGLPPTTQAVDTFVNSRDPRAYEKLIDELLDSKHYGERWGRHWLDVARFAESHGFEQDYDRPHAFHYRDFVIKALNQDMPYTQFVAWQLAGDEIAPDNPLAMMATGFLGAGVFPTQLTEKEFESARYDELDDMVSTMGTAMLGLTIGCARCHDHKFDPIPQADYYRLVSVFRTTIRSEISLDLASDEQRAALAKKRASELKAAQAALSGFEAKQLPAAFDAYIAKQKNGQESTPQRPWSILAIRTHRSRGGLKFAAQPDGSLLKQGATPAKDSYTFVAHANLRQITAVRLEALADKSFPKSGPGLADNGNFCLSDFRLSYRPLKGGGEPREAKFTSARVTHEQNRGNLSAAASFDGDRVKSGWAVDHGGIGKDQAAVFILEDPIQVGQGVELTFTLDFDHPNSKHAIGRPRLSIMSGDPQTSDIRDSTPGLPAEVARTLTLLANGKEVSPARRKVAQQWFAGTQPRWKQLNDVVQKLSNPGPLSKPTKVMVCSEGLPKMKHHADGRGFPHFYPKSHFLKRGDVTQKEREAETSYLQVLMRSARPPSANERSKPNINSESGAADGAINDGAPRTGPQETPAMAANHWRIEPPADWRTSYRRRSLANWITDTEEGAGHLLARVIVNRLWQHHFGTGIVATSNGFGAQGAAPTHPELLDWLAGQLIEGGWRLKRMHKLIMLSSTYQQTTATNPANAKTDLENRWLWRRSPRRLEAEVIRDAMLQISGQLDPTQFGPGTLNEGMRRRSIYFQMKRSKLIPMMQLFDQPEPLVSQGGRQATTIAPQALLFMNNPHVRGWAAKFADQLTKHSLQSLEDAVRSAYQKALSREPTKDELRDNVQFLKLQIESYESDKKSNARQLALQDFCQVVFSLNEFVYVQ